MNDKARYVHRPKPDGQMSSICTRCFATITRAYLENDLEALEEAHVCNPEAIRRIAQFRRAN